MVRLELTQDNLENVLNSIPAVETFFGGARLCLLIAAASGATKDG